MCRMCDGFSLEEVLALDAAHIEEHGYVIIAVDGGDESDARSPWAYTVGLLDAAEHPELLVVGLPAALSGSLLSKLAHAVLEHGECFLPGDTIDLGRGPATIEAVDDFHYELDTFSMWHNLADFGAVEAPELEAVQVVLSAEVLGCATRSRAQRPRRPKGRA